MTSADALPAGNKQGSIMNSASAKELNAAPVKNMMTRLSALAGSRTGESQHYEALDGLRGIAAGAVLLGHASAFIMGHSLLDRKILAVEFFFILSGFVIASTYESRMLSGMSFKEFYLRRIIRLYPLIILGTALGTLSLALADAAFQFNRQAALAVLLNGLGIPGLLTNFSFGRFPLNPPEWSLFFELVAYALFGLLITRAKSWHLMALTAASLAGYGLTEHSWYWLRQDPPFLARGFGPMASFCLGILIWRHHNAHQMTRGALPFAVLSLIILGACLLPFPWGWGINMACIAVVFPLVIVYGAAHGKKPAGLTARLLGELSYPVYMLHWPVLVFTKYLFLNRLGSAGTTAVACALAILTAFVALLSFDLPARKWLGDKLIGASGYRHKS